MGPQGSSSCLPSPRRWESELRLASADSGSVLMKLCLRQSGEQVYGQRLTVPRAPSPRRSPCSGPDGAWGCLPPVALGVADTLRPMERSQGRPLVDQRGGELLGALGQGSVVTRDQACPGMGRAGSGWLEERAGVGKGISARGEGRG